MLHLAAYSVMFVLYLDNLCSVQLVSCDHLVNIILWCAAEQSEQCYA